MEVLLDSRRQRKLESLLLIYLFVGNVAAQCSRPEIGGIIILTEEALLKNDFPEGSEVTLECGNGYKKESGSGVMKCIEKEWSQPDLVCSKKDCGPPKAEENMYFDIRDGTLFGSKIKVMCKEGYQISGSSFKHCYANGWFGKARCNIVTCAKPTEVKNGKNSWNADINPQYGQMINFTCNEGYVMHGSQSIFCTKTGVYDSLPPQCIGVATEDKITTKIVTTATTEQETSTPSVFTITLTSHRASITRVPMNISTTEQGHRFLEGKAASTSVPTSTVPPWKDQNMENINKDKGYTAVIISVIVVTLVLCIFAFILNKFLMRRKGSYDTGEDLKPELLQFQTL